MTIGLYERLTVAAKVIIKRFDIRCHYLPFVEHAAGRCARI